MDDTDIAVRNLTYRLFVENGSAPGPVAVADAARSNPDRVVAAWRRLHEAHALVLDEDRTSIRMANPFSAVPTPYRVRAAGRDWFGNCAWDAFGICAALHTDGDIHTDCRDCGAPIDVGVRDQRPTDDSLLFHCLVPAAQWWDDIVFT